MFAKLATVIIVLGAMYGALLVNRQKRIDAASEMSLIQFRLHDADQRRVRLQVDVAKATTVSELEKKLAQAPGSGDFKSIPNRYDPENMKTPSAVEDPRTVAQRSTGSKKKAGAG